MAHNQPFIILGDSTQRTQGRDAQSMNIAAGKAVAESVRTTLGPRGMDKMLVTSSGDVIITNDGATNFKQMDIEHPAAQMIVEVYQSQKEQDRYSEIQGQLMAGEMNFPEFIRSEKLQLAVSDVYYLSHWITPSSAPARFDTRFFLAAMPDDQVADRHERELVSGQWVTATDALEHHENKRWQMIYPTITNLKSIASYSTVAEDVTAVEKRQHLPSINAELHQQGMQYDSV